MKIAFCGTQSTGKTTLLNEMIKWKEFGDYFISTNISRTLQQQGYPINEEGDYLTQVLIEEKHIENLTHSNLLADRSILDAYIYSYYLFLHGKITEVEMSDLEEIFEKYVFDYDMLFYIKPEFPLFKDGVRSESEEFRREIDNLFDQFIQLYELPQMVLVSGTLEERIQTIRKIIDEYEENCK